MRKTMKVAFVAAVVAMAGYGVYTNQKAELMSDVMLENIEALADEEGNYNKKIWERFYRPEGDGYNCTQTGHETC